MKVLTSLEVATKEIKKDYAVTKLVMAVNNKIFTEICHNTKSMKWTK